MNIYYQFATEILDIAQEFADKNNAKLFYGTGCEIIDFYVKDKSPIKEGLIYYLIDNNRKSDLKISFYKTEHEIRFFIDNKTFSLGLDIEYKRINNVSDIINEYIDNLDSNNDEKVLEILDKMWELRKIYRYICPFCLDECIAQIIGATHDNGNVSIKEIDAYYIECDNKCGKFIIDKNIYDKLIKARSIKNIDEIDICDDVLRGIFQNKNKIKNLILSLSELDKKYIDKKIIKCYLPYKEEN